jgi:hypothetical protein
VGEITQLKRSVFAVKANNSQAAHAGTGFFSGVSRCGSTAFRFGKAGFNSTHSINLPHAGAAPIPDVFRCRRRLTGADGLRRRFAEQ